MGIKTILVSLRFKVLVVIDNFQIRSLHPIFRSISMSGLVLFRVIFSDIPIYRII